LEAPLDERLANLLTGTVTTRSQHAEARQIFVITHVDSDPQFVGQIGPLLDTFVNDSLNDAGVQAFALLSQNADSEPLSARRDFRRPAGIQRPRERAAYRRFSE